ncbi:MAG: hypothetical protein KF760_30295 [Candidatus Eremiobacteraeota bacterium]|nr:hypothetical protein [Candidatus Eremiobacteraeota bacterium]MCW5868129.1 hypothetical protein [Candidatus Eremiobacteraeota bacterium]
MERNEAEQALISRVSDRLQQRIAQEPRPDEATRMKMIEAMRANGADPAYIHAFEKTGLLVFQETMHLIEPADLEAWHQAYEEYGRPGKGVRPESPEEGEL